MENHLSEDQETCIPEIICDSTFPNLIESKTPFNCPFAHAYPAPQLLTERLKPPKPNPKTDPALLCLTCKSPNTQCVCKEKRSSSQHPSYEQINTPFPGCYTKEIKTGSKDLCSNCRESGHLPKECPKDPNTRTGIDQQKTAKKRTRKLTHANYQMSKESFSDIEKLKEKIQGQKVTKNSNFLIAQKRII